MKKLNHKLGVIAVICLLIGSTFLPVVNHSSDIVYAEDTSLRQLNELDQGEEIIFAGYEWVVLEPSEGYIVRKEGLLHEAFDPNGTNIFDPSDSNNIGYYLDKTYFNGFTDGGQKAILPKMWEIGPESSEGDKTVEANIALLSRSEWKEYGETEGGFLNHLEVGTWFRTPAKDSESSVSVVHYLGNLGSSLATANFMVRPALTLDANLFVNSDNEVIITDVWIKPGGSEQWKKSHSPEVTVDNYKENTNIEYAWSKDTGAPASNEWDVFTNGKKINTPSGETGDYYLHIRGTDYYDDSFYKVSDIFKIDNIAPTSPEIEVSTDWTTDNQVMIKAGTDDDSGINKTEYKLGEDDWETFRGESKEITIETEGITTIQARTEDHAGNMSETTTKTVKIDRTEPTLLVKMTHGKDVAEYDETWTNETVNVTVEAEDENIKALQVFVNGEEAEHINGFMYQADYSKEGSYELKVKATDLAGNITEKEKMIKIDKTAPELTVRGDNPLILEVGTAYDEPGATADDNIDGYISDKVKITGEIDTNKLGIYYVYYNVSDSSGNEASQVVREVQVVAPEIIWLELDQPPVQVYAGSLIKVKNTNTTIQLPKNLPEDTTLSVNKVDISPEGYDQTGEIYGFDFIYPEDAEDYTGDFILTLGVNEDAEDPAIYHYDGQTEEWEHVGGDIEDGQITATVNDFSTYGVFSPEEDDSKELPTDPGDKDQDNGENEGNGNDSNDNNDEISDNNGDKNGNKGEKDDQDKDGGGLLPKTATDHYNLLLIGFSLLVLATFVWGVNRKRQRIK